jgi:short-subunit dehydrogenase
MHSCSFEMNVIVSGASKGIGRAIAEIFAANGHNIFICARGEVRLYQAMQELATRYPNVEVRAKPFDVSVQEQASAFGNWCLSFGKPDILVNNAGVFEPGEVHSEADGVLERQLAVNLYSAYHLTRTIVPSMIAGGSGHIFNICSIASLAAYRHGGAYSISKFAMHGFHKNLREELKPHGIKVTALFPGAVHTDSWEGFDNSNARIMESGDVAKMIYTCTQLSPAACVEEIILRPQAGDL